MAENNTNTTNNINSINDRKKDMIDKFPNSIVLINNSNETPQLVTNLQIVDLTTHLLKSKLTINENSGVSLDELRNWLEKINSLEETLNEISEIGVTLIAKHFKTRDIQYKPLREKVSKLKQEQTKK